MKGGKKKKEKTEIFVKINCFCQKSKRFEFGLPCPFSPTITIIPQAPVLSKVLCLPNPFTWAECDTGSLFKQSFPSPKLVSTARLKSQVCLTIYL